MELEDLRSMVALQHKRSAARLISPPFPTASSTMVFETAESDQRWTGNSLAPREGYSDLFTSGFLGPSMGDQPSPTLSSFPSPPIIIRGPFHPFEEASPKHIQSQKSPPDHLSPNTVPNMSPSKTPVRRRRSSIIHTAPMSASPRIIKSGGLDAGVERALDNAMRSLKSFAMGTPKRGANEESRWSSSGSELSIDESAESGFWRPRKSGESTRSRTTMRSVAAAKSAKSAKSTKSTKSLARKSEETEQKSRKSEDTDRRWRMDVETDRMKVDEEIPPVPVTPMTPRRSRRMMEGLVKRLGLTPKKNKPEPEPTYLPPPPVERNLPKKSSFSTLRSALTKRTSTSTLKSTRSALATSTFVGSSFTLDLDAVPPPLPPRWKEGEHGEGCLPIPTTPKYRRMPKTGIGQPQLQPGTSPSVFLLDMPRRAPGMPKKDDPQPPPMPELVHDTSDTIDFGTPMSAQSLGTPVPNHENQHIVGPDTVEIISFNTPPPLMAFRAAGDANALKPKRLMDLRPRQQRVNLVLQNPPTNGLGTKKSTDDISGLIFAPWSKSSMLYKGVVNECLPAESSSTGLINQPFTFTGPDEWDAPTMETSPHGHFQDKPFGTFGATGPLAVKSRGGILDLTASPEVSFSKDEPNLSFSKDEPDLSFASNVSVHNFDTTQTPIDLVQDDGRGRAYSVGNRSDATMASEESEDDGLPKEEWELETYLKQLERVDRERGRLGVQ